MYFCPGVCKCPTVCQETDLNVSLYVWMLGAECVLAFVGSLHKPLCVLPPFSIFALLPVNWRSTLQSYSLTLPCLSLNVLFLSALSLSFSIPLLFYYLAFCES